MYSLVPRPFPEVISQPWKKPVLHDCEIKSESGLGMRLVHAHTGMLVIVLICGFSFFLSLSITARSLVTLCLPTYIHTCAGSEALMLLIGTKLDLVNSQPGTRQVTTEEAKSFASSKHLIDALETSAKEDTNVERTFLRIARALVKRHEGISSYTDPEDSINLTTKSLANGSQCWC